MQRRARRAGGQAGGRLSEWACSEGEEGGACELGGKESMVDGAANPGPGEHLCHQGAAGASAEARVWTDDTWPHLSHNHTPTSALQCFLIVHMRLGLDRNGPNQAASPSQGRLAGPGLDSGSKLLPAEAYLAGRVPHSAVREAVLGGLPCGLAWPGHTCSASQTSPELLSPRGGALGHLGRRHVSVEHSDSAPGVVT